MQKLVVSLLFLCAAGSSALAQDAAPGACTIPDTVVVAGNTRVSDATIRAAAGLTPRTTLNYRDIQRAIKAVFATGQFDDVQVVCLMPPAAPRIALSIQVRERPVLAGYTVVGPDRVDPKDVKDRLALAIGRPLDPGVVAKAVERADSLYESKGYYLARIHADSTISGDKINIAFRVEEGRRLDRKSVV